MSTVRRSRRFLKFVPPLINSGAVVAREPNVARPHCPSWAPSLLMRIGVWTAQVWNECARQMDQVAEGVRHPISHPLLNACRLKRRCGSRIADVLRGVGRALRFFRRRGSVDRRSAGIGFAEAFALLAGFCCEIFSGGFFLELLFGFDGSADSFDTDAVCVALGFGV